MCGIKNVQKMRKEFDSGKFVISLDFELFWGVRDKKTIEDYGANILGVRQAIPAMLTLFDKYEVKSTFSTVGFLFAPNRDVLLRNLPDLKPSYSDANLSPYKEVETVGFDENDDPYHFGFSLLKQVMNNKNHEVGTHTFCHYYCVEPGQSAEEFRHDLLAAQQIAALNGIAVKSLVFPRNQFNEEYLAVCKESGIESYRGNPTSWLYEPRSKNDESLIRRAWRFADTYINLTGHHCYTKSHVENSLIYNIAGSRFLRPYSHKLSFLDSLRLRRIKKAMLHAARNKQLFHLWWHPHNFGANLTQNINFLGKILQYYQELHNKYHFNSVTMTGLVDEMKKSHE